MNLGILAHVDAGKTTLTERLLYDAGVIRELGSVDRGTTQTDTLALERQRGITIKAAVVSFPLHGVTVNLIDTPGHPDFIAEVERALGVLDGAVLVVSAVEGVQAQTLVLMRALQRLRIPTLLFVNKTDRMGADVERVLGEIRRRLSPVAVAASAPDIEALAELDEAVLAAYVAGETPDTWAALARLTPRALVQPVFAGSAITGTGVDDLRRGIVELLPTASGAPDGPLAAAVFKIERTAAGEKVAYVRLFDGTLRTRERVGDEKVTALSVFDEGGAARATSVSAGRIAKVWGLRSLRIGDRIGAAPAARREFAPPTLEAVVHPDDADDGHRLRLALDQLAEQDPLISVRQDEEELSVAIYGEVQKEVLQATLLDEFGLAVSFRETKPIYVERVTGTGEAAELLNAPTNPFHAQLGLRVEPGEGVEVRVEIADHARIPLYVYKRREEFDSSMEEYVRAALRRGNEGYAVVDCLVTVIDSWYSLADGPPSRRGPMPTAADFRGLTPLVLKQALARAGTVVCEPILRVRVELPATAVGAVLAALGRVDAVVETSDLGEDVSFVEALVPAARVHELQQQLPALTAGEGVLESAFAGYRPAVRAVPG